MDTMWFRLARIRLGLTMEEVAKELGTTRQTIGNIELGKAKNGVVFNYYKFYLETKLKESNLPTLEV